MTQLALIDLKFFFSYLLYSEPCDYSPKAVSVSYLFYTHMKTELKSCRGGWNLNHQRGKRQSLEPVSVA